MSDLIDRQAAIDAINHICPVDTEYDCTLLDRVDVRYVLLDLPSAQPERNDALEKAVAVEAISDELMSRFDISATYAYEIAEKVMNRIEAMAKELEREESRQTKFGEE